MPDEIQMTQEQIIAELGLEPLPEEGGFFRQTYLATDRIASSSLPDRYEQDMAASTAICALLTAVDFSAMHILETDEIFHHYLGDPLEMLLLHPDGSGEVFILGPDIDAGMRPQKLVPRSVWQGSRPVPDSPFGYTLLGTTMAPGFTWEGFRLGGRDELVDRYPAFGEHIIARVR